MSIDDGLSLLADGNCYSLSAAARPVVPVDGSELALYMAGRTATVMVHGFQYDPAARSEDNPHLSTFDHWRADLLPGDGFGFGWYSVPFGPLSLMRAWLHGRYNRYRYAWDLATVAGGVLRKVVATAENATIICHSLGSHVTLTALSDSKAGKLPVSRVVILNGAAHRHEGIAAAARQRHVTFYNFVVAEDDVLKTFGGIGSPGRLYSPCIGQAGIGTFKPDNWHDIRLDDPTVQKWGKQRGWDLRGDNPDGYWDHWYSHKHPGNWGLIRSLLAGEEMEVPC